MFLKIKQKNAKTKVAIIIGAYVIIACFIISLIVFLI